MFSCKDGVKGQKECRETRSNRASLRGRGKERGKISEPLKGNPPQASKKDVKSGERGKTEGSIHRKTTVQHKGENIL